MAPGLTQAKFYDRTVIDRMSRTITYGTDRAGSWVRRASAIANGSRLSVTARLWCALTIRVVLIY